MDENASGSEFDPNIETESDDYDDEDQNKISHSQRQRRSYVWDYFKEVAGNANVYRCILCNATVSNKTTNLGRHLNTMHSINDRTFQSPVGNKRGRPSRSFIWKYCTRANEKQAYCHLCQKFLYFGGGNTSNISKHLRRKHSNVVVEGESVEQNVLDESAVSSSKRTKAGRKSTKAGSAEPIKRTRKGSSYVWKYCEKVSKHMVLCNLCDRTMRFHGTANVITHLQRKHQIVGSSPDNPNVVKPPDGRKKAEPVADKDKAPRRLNGNGVVSVVWKFCRRLNEDTVRCRICLKNLSYQGTSNLQRHLHRMHNIVASGRVPKTTVDNVKLDVIFQFCQATEDPQVMKCQMCEELFEHNEETENIVLKHMVTAHGLASDKPASTDGSLNDEEVLDEFCVDDACNAEMVAGDNALSWSKAQHMEDVANDEMKRYDEYDDIIEEDMEVFNAPGEQEIAEQHFDEQLPTFEQQTANVENPLSPASSADSVSETFHDDIQMASSEIKQEIPQSTNTRMSKLTEELVRQKTIYFNEKAGFYRMQKYLVALQAKKERLQIEMMCTQDKDL